MVPSTRCASRLAGAIFSACSAVAIASASRFVPHVQVRQLGGDVGAPADRAPSRACTPRSRRRCRSSSSSRWASRNCSYACSRPWPAARQTARPRDRVCPASTKRGRSPSDARRGPQSSWPELFHKSGEVSYSPAMAVDPELLEILACPNCKTPVTLVKNGTALKCAHVQARLPDQGRHSGHAHRRSHDRDRELQTGCRLNRGSCSFGCGRLATSSSRRRPFGRCAQRFPDAHITYLVEPAAAPVVADNPHLDEVIVAPRRRGLRGLSRRPRARPAAARGDASTSHRLSRRAARVAAHLAERRARRVGYEVAGRAWMYTTRVARPRELRPRHSVENQWDLLAALGIAGPSPSAVRSRCRSIRTRRARVDERLANAGVTTARRV